MPKGIPRSGTNKGWFGKGHNLGGTMPEEVRLKIKENHARPHLGKKQSIELIAKRGLGKKGKDAWRWKGEDAGYGAKHSWISKNFGKPRFCMSCFTDKAKEYDWHSLSRQYKREIGDWIRLCRDCHWYFDRNSEFIMTGK